MNEKLTKYQLNSKKQDMTDKPELYPVKTQQLIKGFSYLKAASFTAKTLPSFTDAKLIHCDHWQLDTNATTELLVN